MLQIDQDNILFTSIDELLSRRLPSFLRSNLLLHLADLEMAKSVKDGRYIKACLLYRVCGFGINGELLLLQILIKLSVR
jgi:hypothetical protein